MCFNCSALPDEELFLHYFQWLCMCVCVHVYGWAVRLRGPFHQRFFAHNSNSMETLTCHNSVAGHQIATNFCTCHDSTAVVPCTKLCGDHCIRIELIVKRNFHRIWIAMEKLFVKRAPGPDSAQNYGIPGPIVMQQHLLIGPIWACLWAHLGPFSVSCWE